MIELELMVVTLHRRDGRREVYRISRYANELTMDDDEYEIYCNVHGSDHVHSTLVITQTEMLMT